MAEPIITAPAGGAKITISGGKLNVPNNPIIPFIEGDGTGADITPVMLKGDIVGGTTGGTTTTGVPQAANQL